MFATACQEENLLPTPSPSITAFPTLTLSPLPTLTPTLTPSQTPTATQSPTLTPTASPTSTATAMPSPTIMSCEWRDVFGTAPALVAKVKHNLEVVGAQWETVYISTYREVCVFGRAHVVRETAAVEMDIVIRLGVEDVENRAALGLLTYRTLNALAALTDEGLNYDRLALSFHQIDTYLGFTVWLTRAAVNTLLQTTAADNFWGESFFVTFLAAAYGP